MASGETRRGGHSYHPWVTSAPAPAPAPAPVLPWSAADRSTLARVAGVLTDIDDTLTTEGVITDDALAAIADLHAAGIPVIAVTGRPMGWSVPVVARTALDAVVAENGAVALFRAPEAEGGGVAVEYAQPEAERAANAERLRAVAARVLREVPGATLAQDSPGRVTDIAVDHAEFAHLDATAVERVVALMREAGMVATVSSIHVNGWFGEHSKLTGARWIVERRLGRDLDAEHERWIYVGDSTNDQLMFGAFPLSVGVANLRAFAAELTTWPRYLTAGARGAGFAEVARAVLDARADGGR